MPEFSGLSARQSRAAKWSAYRRAAGMIARGLVRRPFFGTAGGPLFLGRRVRITNPSFIRYAGRLVVEDGVELQGLSKNGIVFGSGVSIGAGTAIRPSSYYGGEVGEGLRVGDRSSVATGCFIGCSGSIVIGDDVMLGPGVRVFSENHVFSDPSATIKSQGVQRGAVTIGDDCWIGSGVTITSGVTIGRGVVIGSGSVVTRDIPDYSIAAGSPAKVIRTRQTSMGGDGGGNV
ncbi:acyltransferase [Microbacterium sp. 4-7]|uniref:acyltransferase n=1 Tax=Microbacterium sp. 4-7 TaxID=1885327 RepID=UPI00164F843F|nr:acyltransferase [Microbacterium sp. 4-7]